MPNWVLLLVLVIAGWLSLSVVGGFVIGRLLALSDRHARKRLVL